jgi:restriction endonuclease Mrr
VDLKVLAQFEELHEFRQGRTPPADGGGVPVITDGDERTPEERIDSAYRELRSALATELLDRVLEQSPEFFERLVLRVAILPSRRTFKANRSTTPTSATDESGLERKQPPKMASGGCERCGY